MKAEQLTLRVRGRNIYPLWQCSLAVGPAEILAVVGESGSGKTSLAWALMGHPLPGQEVVNGRVHFAGRDMLRLSETEKRRLYFRELGFVPQNAAQSLHPTQTVAASLAEIWVANGSRDLAGAVRPWLEGLDLPAGVLARYPHQLSGGQRQRVALVAAGLNRPRMLILDEPTSALDLVTQKKVVELLRHLNSTQGTALVIFTHDLGLVQALAHRVAVLYAGQVVEEIPASALERARHPYTRGLLAARPRLGDARLSRSGISGYGRPLSSPPRACSFAPRCPQARELCRRQAPPLAPAGEGQVRCFV
ncbi:MAG: ABC transporter ATP-binding protein [Moorellales bacterium]